MKKHRIFFIHIMILFVFVSSAQENKKSKQTWQIDAGYSFIHISDIDKLRTGGIGLGCWTLGWGGTQNKSNAFKLGISKNVSILPSLNINFGYELNYFILNKNADICFSCISGKFNEKSGEIKIKTFFLKIPLTARYYFFDKKFFINGGLYGLIPFSDAKYDHHLKEYRRFPDIVITEPKTVDNIEILDLNLTYGWTTSIGYVFKVRKRSLFAKLGYSRSLNDLIYLAPRKSFAMSGLEFNLGVDM